MKVIKIVLIVLALVGALTMGYLLNIHLTPADQSFCDLGEGLSCGLVNSSEYAKIVGIPVSLLGLIYFLGVLYLLVAKYSRKNLGHIAFVTTVFLGPSLYLTSLELFVINNICVLCEGSKIIMALIIVLALLGMKPVRFNAKKVLTAIALALIFAGGTYILQNKNEVPSGTYDTFAQCIYDSGLRMYGSQGCSFCAKQRALLGDSVEFIKEIECDVRYSEFNPQPELCVAKDIKHTPTWILEDKEGNTVTKFEPGVLSLEELSEASACRLIKDTPLNQDK